MADRMEAFIAEHYPPPAAPNSNAVSNYVWVDINDCIRMAASSSNPPSPPPPPPMRPGASPGRWTKIHRIPLEPKHQSLVWRVRHGCVPATKILAHMVPGLSALCPVCAQEREDQAHYSAECPSVRAFWAKGLLLM
ncbi:hypothetical protein H4R18_003805 [Coemansia javaensis]|uniref:Reverse transcriptase zinc-binding domain-containing protein n=1 Tax=Coemansia javaensis TaxID=2761396 RepID=A0A9W8LGR0_9FUNG|nr:hypothetical protein H4R18_003805 [Coemansia javaensis]